MASADETNLQVEAKLVSSTMGEESQVNVYVCARLCTRTIFALLSVIYNLQNCKIAQRQWRVRTGYFGRV